MQTRISSFKTIPYAYKKFNADTQTTQPFIASQGRAFLQFNNFVFLYPFRFSENATVPKDTGGFGLSRSIGRNDHNGMDAAGDAVKGQRRSATFAKVA